MNENKPKLLCRLIGHRWKPAHVLREVGWVYTDDVCTRCYMTEYRLPPGFTNTSEGVK